MSLPTPHLDDRTFQSIVDDTKRQIGLRCPEWSDNNVSDPGVTLIELFAWMTEMTLFRLNQVPQKNYLKFLEMLGAGLEPPAPAQVELRFDLAQPLENEGDDSNLPPVLARPTIAATVRTESEEAITFATEADVRFVRAGLEWMFAVPTGGEASERDWRDFRGFTGELSEARERYMRTPDASESEFRSQNAGFPVFAPTSEAKPEAGNPGAGDGAAFYLGFRGEIGGGVVQLDVQCRPAAARGLVTDYPSQIWEYWDARERHWERLRVPVDTSRGFNEPGRIELEIPRSIGKRAFGEREGYWVRCRYTPFSLELPPRGDPEVAPASYGTSPQIDSLSCQTVGGLAPAANCVVVEREPLGESDGLPGQVFSLRHAPVLPRGLGETISVGATDINSTDRIGWQEVADFAESGPTDLHFMLDSLTGEVFFGPLVGQPDGTPPRQHGAIPPRGATIWMDRYRCGGGTLGNVREGQIKVLKESLPKIAAVSNALPARGGRDLESLEHAILRAQRDLRVRERAVTAEDYEHLARRASPGVGRAHCLQPGVGFNGGKGAGDGRLWPVPPGMVRVLLVPALDASVLAPRALDLATPARVESEVQSYLDERRLLTTTLEITEPDYVFLSTDITLVAAPGADPEVVASRVREALLHYVHPLRGGPTGEGWPFGRHFTMADLYAQVQSAPGVAFLLEAKLFTSRLRNREERALGRETAVKGAEGVRLSPGELLASREHRISVRPMASFSGSNGGAS